MTIVPNPWRQFKPIKGQLYLSLLSGLLLIPAFPKADQGWLAWVALVPLFLALRKADGRQGFALGFCAGLVHNIGLLYWTIHTMRVYGGLPLYQCVLVLILLSGYLALYGGLFGLILARIQPRPWQLPLLASAIWTGLELLRTCLFTGFPWGLLGYSQYDYLWVRQWADLFGVYGVSALIVMVNGTAALLLLYWIEQPWQGTPVSSRGLKWSAALTLVIITSVIGYGARRVGTMDQAIARAPRATVAVIQGNIDQAHKWDPGFQLLTTVKYKNLSMQAAAEKPDLIVWPETATPFYFTQDPLLSRMVMEGIRDAGTDFIIGSPSAVAETGTNRITYRNSAYLVASDGRILGQYDKVHLVPFGEYVPLKRFLPFINKLVAQVGDFKPGRRGTTLAWGEHPVGMQICYEVIFPGLVRAMVNNGAHLLVNITNDAWFDRTGAPYQHFAMAVFRAVENRRSLARAANTGISGFIDPCGRVSAATGLFEDALAVSPLALMTQRTLYTRWGDWPLAVLVAILLCPWIIREIRGFWHARQKRIRG